MKNICGILLMILGFVALIGISFAGLAWGIMDIIKMVNGEIPVTFGSIFFLVAVFAFREFVGAIVFFFFAGIGYVVTES